MTPSLEQPDASNEAAPSGREPGEDIGPFYARWFDWCVFRAMHLTRRDEAFCLDVVQDVFLSLVRKRVRLPDEGVAERWLTTAILRAGIDRVRSEKRRRARDHAHMSQSGARDVRDDEIQRLREALEALRPDDHTLILLRFARRLSGVQASAALGLGEYAGQGRVRRAIAAIRGQIAPQDSVGSPDDGRRMDA